MVEKIIVNPSEVRGLGDIVDSKGASDFIVYGSGVTETTDTVNGATSKVFNQTDTKIFYDMGVTGRKSTDWYVRTSDTTLTVNVEDDGTALSNSSTTTSVYYFANPAHSTSTAPPITMSDFVIECDILSSSYTSTDAQVSVLLQGISSAFNLKSYTAPYHLKLVKDGTSVTKYVDGTSVGTTTISSRNNYYTGFQLYKECSIKFKNYIIYSI